MFFVISFLSVAFTTGLIPPVSERVCQIQPFALVVLRKDDAQYTDTWWYGVSEDKRASDAKATRMTLIVVDRRQLRALLNAFPIWDPLQP